MKEQRIYLDYIATTPVDPQVQEAMEPYWRERYGNPSSIHALGQEAMVAVDKARDQLAKFLRAEFSEVYFTGSATEADNWAIRGVLASMINNGIRLEDLHVITSAIEHKAVLEPLKVLEKRGLQVTYLKPNKQGVVEPWQVEKALQESTVLVSVMAVNNEIGSILPLKDIFNVIQNERKRREQEFVAKQKKKFSLPIYFHSDAVQAAQFYNLDVQKLGVDLLTLSAHKLYGPKGVGALYVRQGVQIEPLIFGGGQEGGLRSGTENVAGIVGFGKAIELISLKQNEIKKRLSDLQEKLWQGIKKTVGKVELVGPELGPQRAPNNLSVWVPDVPAENLIIALDQEGVAVSSGSACTAGTVEPSHVLLALGFDHKKAGQVIRMSLGQPTTEEEIQQFLEIFPAVVQRLRR